MPQSESAFPAVSPLTPAPITQVRGSSGIAPEPIALFDRVSSLEADGARDARSAQAAIPVRVLRQVLLVVILGVVEGPGGRDLGRDLAEAGAGELLGVGVLRSLDGGALSLVRVVGGRAVLSADVVALAHALRRVVALPE